MALELTIGRFPNFKHDTNYGWKMTPECRLLFAVVEVTVRFLKLLLNKKKFVKKRLLRVKNLGMSLRNFLVVKSSK